MRVSGNALELGEMLATLIFRWLQYFESQEQLFIHEEAQDSCVEMVKSISAVDSEILGFMVAGKIIDNLNFILSWLGNTNLLCPERNFNCYQVGLNEQEINSLIGNLPFAIPEEIFQLYKWRNGIFDEYYSSADSFLFPDQLLPDVSFDFLSLQEAIRLYDILCQESQSIIDSGVDPNEFEFWKQTWFPVGAFEYSKYIYVACESSPAPVCQFEVGCDNPVRVYKSLTSFTSVIAECCENGIYQIRPQGYAGVMEMKIVIDNSKLELEKAIFQKYNS